MATNKIEESQQQSQGVTIGTQGNQDITIPQGIKGSHSPKEGPDDHSIQNQEKSSASNQQKTEGNRSEND